MSEAIATDFTGNYRSRRPTPTQMRPHPHYTAAKIDYVGEFNELATRWRASTIYMSLIQDKIEDQNFKQIVEMGGKVVPHIIGRLRVKPDTLFYALHLITGENPIPPEHRGRVDLIIRDWLDWWEDNKRSYPH